MPDIKETKRCPYCGEEIKAVAKKCWHCGEWLDKVSEIKKEPEIQPKSEKKTQTKSKAKTQNTISKKLDNRDKLLIAILVILGGVGFIILCFGYYYAYTYNNSKPSSTQVETEDYSDEIKAEDYYDLQRKEAEYYENISYKNIQDLHIRDSLSLTDTHYKINQIENDLKSYFLERHSKKENSKLFLLFLNNLITYSKDASVAPNNYVSDEIVMDKNIYIDSSMFLFSKYQNSYNEGILELISPNIPSVKYVYSGHKIYTPLINYKYLYNSYSKYLSEDINEYLKVKSLEEEDLSENSYYYIESEMSIDSYTLIKWIKYWQDFLKKYPTSILVPRVKLITISYSAYMLQHNAFKNGKLTNEAKKSYEYVLDILDKNSNEYKRFKKCYDILKENQYAYSEEYSEKCGGVIPYYEDMY